VAIEDVQRPDLKRVVERENQAYDARVAAFLKVKETYIKYGNGGETYRSMKTAEIAEAAWRAAKNEADRIRTQLRIESDAPSE
jgi:hypothetical protein